MAPPVPGTGVFSLESTPSLGLSISHKSGLEPLELGGIQSCFAVPGSVAEARNLHRRGKAGAQAVYGGQGPIFVHSSLGDSTLNTNATGLYAAGGSLGHSSEDICECADLHQGWGALDAHCTIGFPDAIEDR
jgi:hypothetical protein